ncbi:8-amino-7-oxononanoate synthase (plasmid) [Alicyclobacillus fastidiosus]|uniref:8-amino-7-ketopelargonate synthase n=1 Tax=Alicyclobacillus fastidiosus TaxID=392011 RepID=A0ABY6ZPJ6_9BACL|nr:8-amino-7-oxononanoate synthase [Alicyclobacillus fastidiosus]WAH44777.1 8-amino-7-oxononanoate synthase [Alicyclobacillus fastidiosus]GMA65729.1 8-amino-7-oxononanoate synthase 2 [Alicyclobacillus fastidiosus]GMA65902.1 8-amino-7-oxononanoate synthase 2 [Alicyclobacillus fastidiosus]
MKRFQDKLSQLKEAGLHRRLRTMSSASAPRVQVDGRWLVMCAANNYLGLVDDERVRAAAVDAIVRYGTGSSGSRLITGTTDLHVRLEAAIAAFKQTEAALVFNNGYMANMAALSSLVGTGDVIFSDELNHASIIDGCRQSKASVVVYRHNDMNDLRRKLEDTPASGQRLIVTDGVFSMDGDLANLPAIVDVADTYEAWVMVDDAHATGVFGQHGGGTADYYGIQAERIAIQVGTLSKAIGSEGGFIAGSRVLIDYLVNCARPFVFSTALSPPVLAAAMRAIEIIQTEGARRDHLHALTKRLRRGLLDAGFEVLPGTAPIIPIILGDPLHTLEFSRHLEENGVFATAIRPPTVPPGTSRIRFTLMATHTDDDIEHIIQACIAAGRGLGVIS